MRPASDVFTYSVVLVHLPYHGVSAYLGRLGLAPT
jgi:hypothetical protein